MKEDTIRAIGEMIREAPFMGATDVPNESEVDSAANRLGTPFIPDYREFLLHFGAAMVGPYPVFGLRPVPAMDAQRWSVVTITESIRRDVSETAHWVIFSEDHAGNPIGFDRHEDIWIYDHDEGVTERIAGDFESYIRRNCLGH